MGAGEGGCAHVGPRESASLADTDQRIDERESYIRLLIKVAKLGKCDSCGGFLADPVIKGCDSMEHAGSAQIVRDSQRMLDGA